MRHFFVFLLFSNVKYLNGNIFKGKDAFVKCAEIFLVAKKPLFAKTYYLKSFK